MQLHLKCIYFFVTHLQLSYIHMYVCMFIYTYLHRVFFGMSDLKKHSFLKNDYLNTFFENMIQNDK